MARALTVRQQSGAATDRGPRPVNEDAVLVADLPGGDSLVAVADGMGGQQAGEVASRTAVAALAEAVTQGLDLRAAVVAANRAVLNAAAATPEHEGMATTLVAMHRQGGRYMLANVGDSRAYRLDEHGVSQLTRDHSFVAEAVASGQLTEEAAQTSRWRNAVTRAIGTDPVVDVDLFGPFDAAERHSVLLCTDGLYRVLDPDDLHQMSLAGGDVTEASRHLCAAAVAAGTRDNVSAAVVRFGAPLPPPMPRPVTPVPHARPRPPARGRWRARQRRRWFTVQVLLVVAGVLALAAYLAALRVLL